LEGKCTGNKNRYSGGKMKKVIALAVLAVFAVLFTATMADKAFYSVFIKKSLAVQGSAGKADESVVTEKDLKGLPAPVAKYIRFAGIPGKKRISSVHLTHGGTFLASEKIGWRPIKGEYYLTAIKPSFNWYGKISAGPGINVTGWDSYFEGKGAMHIRLQSMVPIEDEAGDRTDISSFGRFVSEMAMMPTVFLDRNIVKWEKIDGKSASAVVTDSGLGIKAVFVFAPDGGLDRVQLDRFRIMDGKTEAEKYSVIYGEYKDFNGYKVPTNAEAVWNLKTGDQSYVKFKIEKAEIE
jgi:hypothetical protein